MSLLNETAIQEIIEQSVHRFLKFAEEGESRGYADDATWILTASFVIFTMQTGFGLIEMGSCQAGNEVNILLKNVVDVVFGELLVRGSNVVQSVADAFLQVAWLTICLGMASLSALHLLPLWDLAILCCKQTLMLLHPVFTSLGTSFNSVLPRHRQR